LSLPSSVWEPAAAMVDGEECAKRVAMGFGVGAALGSSIGERAWCTHAMQGTWRCIINTAHPGGCA
jgi:hypothetical protein